MTEPFIQWIGGKKRLAKAMARYFPQTFSIYYEPFLGSGSTFFFLWDHWGPFEAYLSDIDPLLIGCYLAVRDEPEQVANGVEEYASYITSLHPRARKQWMDNLRKRRPTELGPFGAWYITLNKQAWHGKMKGIDSGKIVMQPTLDKSTVITERDVIMRASKVLRDERVHIMRCHFADALSDVPDDAFVYLDPPYYDQPGIYNHEFTVGDSTWMENIFLRLRCKAAMSNSDCKELESLMKRDNRLRLVRLGIRTDLINNGGTEEVLVLNYAPDELEWRWF